jgi:hypothetical protein
LRPLRELAQSLLLQCGEVHLQWKPRRYNTEADVLSQASLDVKESF